MNHTKNYGLPQWELNDLIRMEDFNNMSASIENGLTSTAAEASVAKTTAKAAMAQANMLPYVTGYYIGNGGTKSVDIGFKPSFLIITAQEPTLQGSIFSTIAILGDQHFSYMVERTGTGFNVIKRTANPGTMPTYPRMNEDGLAYNYIAFR